MGGQDAHLRGERRVGVLDLLGVVIPDGHDRVTAGDRLPGRREGKRARRLRL